ncbi:integral membrane protein [Paraphaeosphaeria minitans]|uniref:Integral membrane protein n=1 Tax=Paraphaeosphaeria minitans TaxID=565426 RepID=A0A9P6KT93_9PLEO|nr:integral membrane protein [Paraphaeosphaeria minitans]
MVLPSGRGQAQPDTCTGVATAFTITSFLVVALRTYARSRILRNFGKDDAFMIGAFIFTLGYLVCIWVMRDNGMGYSGKVLILNQRTTLIQTTLAIQILYYLLIACVKISICFCYLRIAPDKYFARLVKGTIYSLATFCVICVIVCLAQCISLRQMWNFTEISLGTCVNTTALFYTTSSINIITDIWIVVLPIRTLLKIRRPNREKFDLVFAFGLGVFSTIASIVRLHAIRIYTESTDPFYDSVPINLWSIIEVNIGIWCASIPSLRIILIRRRAASQASLSAGTYKYHSSGRSGGKDFGNSASEELKNFESLDMGTVDLTNPQVAMKTSKGDSEWSGHGSDDQIYSPGAYNLALKLPV